jgi:hypothetical protein
MVQHSCPAHETHPMIATGNRIRHQTREEITTIGRCAFARLVALHCRVSGHEPDPRDLDEWLAAVWPMVCEDRDAARWARAYLIACGLVLETDDITPAESVLFEQ